MLLSDPMFILAAVASLAVLGILIFGVASFAKGGEFNRRNSNRIMRWRLGAQFVAVVLIVAFAWFKARG
jgi:hypothetical protein